MESLITVILVVTLILFAGLNIFQDSMDAQAALATLAVPHPDLAHRASRVDITRYGHAMAIPVPGQLAFLSQIGLQRFTGKRKQLSNGERNRWLPTPATARLAFAHADWSGYSVFEEAFTRGHAAGLAVLT